MTRINLLLFFIIFLEGYIVLSTELLAIRSIIPFVGGATDTVSIIIAAVLMPLAFGYYAGGLARPPLRRRLAFNLTVSAVILTIGLSYIFINQFFGLFDAIHTPQTRLISASLYALIFLVVPVFLLGQTIPLVSHYLKSPDMPKMTGRILFFSTIGSFMGAVFCTLVLMPLIGVHHTVSITIGCIALLVCMVSRKLPDRKSIIAVSAFLLSLIINSTGMMLAHNIVSNNQYNMVQVYRADNDFVRMMQLNKTMASSIYTKTNDVLGAAFGYIDYIERNFIKPALKNGEKKSILVIGTGGFTVGFTDSTNDYTFVDIDPDLKDTAEKYFLPAELSRNKTFVAEDGRAFLNRNTRKFDLIFLDIYQDPSGPPPYTITVEFYEQVRKALAPDGVAAANIIASPTFADQFSIGIDNTIRAVFPLVTRDVINNYYGWNKSPTGLANVMYVMFDPAREHDGEYTDNKNRAFLDLGRR